MDVSTDPRTRLQQIADRLPNSRIRNDKLRAPCPNHGGDGSNLSIFLTEDGGGLAARCHSNKDCADEAVAATIQRITGIPLNPRPQHTPPPPLRSTTTPTPTPPPNPFTATTTRPARTKSGAASLAPPTAESTSGKTPAPPPDSCYCYGNPPPPPQTPPPPAL